MRDHTVFPVGAWVKGLRWIKGEKERFIGFIEGYDGDYYQVFVVDAGKSVDMAGYRLESMCIEEEVEGDLINFTLDQKQQDWFMELTGGEASGTDEKLLRPSNGD